MFLDLQSMKVTIFNYVSHGNIDMVHIANGMADTFCHNPSFGLMTKAKGLQGCGPRESPRVTSHTPGNVRKCEGMNLHTPKASPTLGDGVLLDSRNSRECFEGSKLNGLWRSLYHWKTLGT
jgi:hypothetical protein